MIKLIDSDLAWHMAQHTIPAALSLLPKRMESDEAVAALLAIGLQESAFLARRQYGAGTAHGFWQFERLGGVADVFTHTATRPLLESVCSVLSYECDERELYEAIIDNDVLAAAFARLLLWIDPSALAMSTQHRLGWTIYRRRWRPGKPHLKAWPVNFATAWHIVDATAAERMLRLATSITPKP